MQIAVGIYMFVHGFAHIVGFLVSWKLVDDMDSPYKTTIMGGKLDLGDTGIRILGIIWLLLGLAFFLMTYAVIVETLWWKTATFYVTYFSLFMSILNLPETKYGLMANILLLLFLWIAPSLGWIT